MSILPSLLRRAIRKANAVATLQWRLAKVRLGRGLVTWAKSLPETRLPGPALRILVADVWVPAFDRDSGSLRMTWIIVLLRSLGCEVTLFSTDDERREPYVAEFEHLGVRVFSDRRTFADFAEKHSGRFDIVLLSRRDLAVVLVDTVQQYFPTATLIFDTVDLHFVREARERELNGSQEVSMGVENTDEIRIAGQSDIVAVVTEVEAKLLQRYLPGREIMVLPNVHSLPPLSAEEGFSARRDLLFVGNFHHAPNADAVIYFVNEVLPLILTVVPVRLNVVGPYPPDSVRALESPTVSICGFVPTLDAHLRSARVFVSPIRYGAGMKGKNGEALAHGLPLVTTSVGAEGMFLIDGQNAMIRDDAASFAEGVIQAYTDEELWLKLRRAGHDVVATHWTPEVIRTQLIKLVGGVKVQR